MLQPARVMQRYMQLSKPAKDEHRRDRLGLPMQDPGIERSVAESVAWLGRAQDHSTSQDGGVARHFSLETGWSTSYPETTGYIVPTMLAYAKVTRDDTLRQRARRMLDWLVSIQFPDGSFQGGTIGAKRIVPVALKGEVGLLHVKSFLAQIEPELKELIDRFCWFYNAEQIAALNLPYS